VSDLKCFAIAFALAGLGAAIRAAHLWWKSGNVPVLPDTAASISDVPGLHITSAQSGCSSQRDLISPPQNGPASRLY
jgi:hypothetical protein